mmetsp:Transcript_8994/g.20264  ORF Transcript_8994/g.20264 Transcript_8994/m.20264 type:complete len:396 (-) Transcript_8994:62-1249(-)
MLLKGGDGIGLGARPTFLLLAAALVLRVGGGVAGEAESVHLHNRRPLLADKVGHRAPCLERACHVGAVDEYPGDAIVLALGEHVAVGGHVGREGVDGAAVVNDQEEDGQLLLGRRVEALGHSAVLSAALADEDDGDPLVVFVLLGLALAVEEDAAGGADGVRQLLAYKRPSALHVSLRVENVHRAARALARAVHLAEKLRHDGIRVDARGEGVAVLAVVRKLDVRLTNRVSHHRRDRLLSVVQVHEAADVSLHVLLVARVLELAAKDHHLVRLEKLLFGGLLACGAGELARELRLNLLEGFAEEGAPAVDQRCHLEVIQGVLDRGAGEAARRVHVEAHGACSREAAELARRKGMDGTGAEREGQNHAAEDTRILRLHACGGGELVREPRGTWRET